jgi:transcriptional regulator with XRE-family HTH domain
MNLGFTIKQLRIEKKLTQEELAASCSLSQTYLSQIENNKKEPNLSVLNSISSCLDVPIAFIFLLAMDSKDVKPKKRNAFKSIQSPLREFAYSFLKDK